MKTKKAWFVSTTGEVKRLPELEGKELKLADMYGIIGNGCHTIEHVGLKKGVDMWVDEEGLLKGSFKVNVKATEIYQDAFGNQGLGVVGHAIITDNTKAGDFIKQ